MSIIASLIGPVTGLLDKFIQDKDQKAALAHDIATLASKQAHEQILAQLEVNKAEAASQSLFVAGWRPAVGWICALGMFSNFLLFPLVNFLSNISGHDVVIPLIDLTTMMPVLLGMLGLGGLRTVEKIQGVQRDK